MNWLAEQIFYRGYVKANIFDMHTLQLFLCIIALAKDVLIVRGVHHNIIFFFSAIITLNPLIYGVDVNNNFYMYSAMDFHRVPKYMLLTDKKFTVSI